MLNSSIAASYLLALSCMSLISWAILAEENDSFLPVPFNPF
nr:MAG TPA: CCSMST1 family protein [Crassvirales sp.]